MLLSDFITPDFSDYIIRLGYIGIFIWYISLDQLTPVPEEITLLTIGYLSANHVFNPFIAGVIALTAFIAVDTVYFFMAKSGNRLIQKVYNRINSKWADRYMERIKTNTSRSLIIICFIPRMRIFGPILSGMLNINYRIFILYDILGLTAFTILYIFLGVIFHKSLYYYLTELEVFRHVIFTFFCILVIIFLIKFINKRKNDSPE